MVFGEKEGSFLKNLISFWSFEEHTLNNRKVVDFEDFMKSCWFSNPLARIMGYFV